MGKHLRKVNKKLKDRRDVYDATLQSRQGYKRPGSQNLRKQGAGVSRVKGR